MAGSSADYPKRPKRTRREVSKTPPNYEKLATEAQRAAGLEKIDTAITAAMALPEGTDRKREGVALVKAAGWLEQASRHFKDKATEGAAQDLRRRVGLEIFGIDPPADAKPQPRNLARFTTDDAEKVLGRPLTAQEERNLVKTLENSSMGEVFAECVNLIADTDENEESK